MAKTKEENVRFTPEEVKSKAMEYFWETGDDDLKAFVDWLMGTPVEETDSRLSKIKRKEIKEDE